MSEHDPSSSESQGSDRTPAPEPGQPRSAPVDHGPGPELPGYTAPLMPVAPGARRRTRSITGVHLSLVVVGLLAGAALFLSGYSLGRHEETTPGTPASEEQAFVPFWDAYSAITQQYAGGTVDRKTVIEGAIRGMIDSLGDPFSSYLSSEDYKKSLQGLAGQFEGIGAQIGARKSDGTDGTCTPLGPTCQMVVIAANNDSPAQKAGVLAGDVITQIDGTTVDGNTVNDAVARVRGPKGTVVTLTIVRGTAAPIQIPITRDVIVQKEVTSKSLANGAVAYVGVTGFSDNSAADAATAIAADVAAGQRKFILDLRGNPGGLVTAARVIASQFIGSGPIFWQEDAQGHQLATLADPKGAATDPSIKLIVLIDKGSASASEIVAGALQDTKRGTLVGVTSYGKGTVQEWQPLPDDAGGFRLTVARWLTPDKRWIHHVGLTPDVTVTTQPTAADPDPVLDKALELLGESSATVAQAAA
jgi:carboxyl-terminal processing protease